MLPFLYRQKFRNRIGLIELTKQLEREPCDSISFTHRMAKTLLPNASYVNYTISAKYGDSETNPYDYFHFDTENAHSLYLAPTGYGKFSVKALEIVKSEGHSPVYLNNFVTVTAPSGEIIISNKLAAGGFGEPSYTPLSGDKEFVEFNINQSGNYTLTYTAGYNAPETWAFLTVTYTIKAVNQNIPAKPIPSITDVLNRILDVGIPRSVGTPPKYRLDPVIAEKFKDTPAPELFIPRMTLYEALSIVGGYIHGVPRLVFNEETQKPDTVTFTLLGGSEYYIIPDECCMTGYRQIMRGDDYCGALDSYAENMINTIDPTAGSIVEPFDGGWKTLRCQSGIEIKNSTAAIETDKPIYRIVKLEMGYTENSKTTPIGDITKYVYEQAEYDGLFTTDTVGYPNSVAYALCYKQGTRYITGFDTTSTSIFNLINNFQIASIEKILAAEGKELPAKTVYANLAFRVTYIPMDNIRIRQYKPYTGYPNGNVIYNQQNANTVESNYYGEMLKGKIARMGNRMEIYTIRFYNVADIPKIGQIFDKQGYIFKVAKKYDRRWITCDIYVTPDFNKLSEYIGLNSNFRLYEISERQSIDRNVMVPRIITFGDKRSENVNLISFEGAKKFMQVFNQNVDTPGELASDGDHDGSASVAVMGLYGRDDELVGETYYAKSVSSIAAGNSLVFTWRFEDNYSVGYQAKNIPNLEYKQRTNRAYGSVYGEFYYMTFGIANTVYGQNREKKQLSYDDQLSTYAKQGFCDKLPVIGTGEYFGTLDKSYFSAISGRARAIDKNSSEVISVTVQFSGQANRKSIVLGSKLWLNNPLITAPDGAKKGKIYLLSKRLNMLRSAVDLTGAYELPAGVEEYMDKWLEGSILRPVGGIGQIKPITNPTTNTYEAWAIVDPTDNGLYIGENMTIEPGGQTRTIYISYDEEA